MKTIKEAIESIKNYIEVQEDKGFQIKITQETKLKPITITKILLLPNDEYFYYTDNFINSTIINYEQFELDCHHDINKILNTEYINTHKNIGPSFLI